MTAMVNSAFTQAFTPVMLASLLSLLFTLPASGETKNSHSTIVVRVADYLRNTIKTNW